MGIDGVGNNVTELLVENGYDVIESWFNLAKDLRQKINALLC